MKKTDKKIEQALSQHLTLACDEALDQFIGFSWLTHTVNYKNFSQSLRITCIFDDKTKLSTFLESGDSLQFIAIIHKHLLSMGIQLKQPKKHIFFDSEQHCDQEHNGNWKLRLNRH